MKKFITIFTTLYLFGALVNIQANTIQTGKSFNPPMSLYDRLVITPLSSRVDVEVLSTLINGTSSEYPLYISEINSGLIYCVDIKSKKNIIVSREFYFSKHDSTSGEWTKPINIVKEYSKFREENKIMNYDEIFITMDDDIYSVNLNNDFYNPQKININTKNIECNPSLSPDGNTLYFVSNRPGGYGGKDIWAAERLSNGKWSMPYNLGKDINTAENEESPFIMPDGATLCFSSIGHNSYGGYDIYTATQNDEGLWSAPENLGAPVNSAYDDYNFIINSEGVNAYYSSNKMEKSNQNIYFVRYHLDK